VRTLLLSRLTQAHLAFPVGPQVFSSLVADTLGVAATPHDGFDDMHAAVMREIPVDESVSPHLHQHVADAEFQDGAIRSGQIVPLGHDIDAFNQGIEPDGNRLNHVLATTPQGVGRLDESALGRCPPGVDYNPFWEFMGWKNGCTPPSKK
jgi:hypothetical protein